MKQEAALNFYITQLGVFSGRGRLYLCRIAQAYLGVGCEPQYEQFLLRTAQEENRKAESVKGAIRHFLRRSWERGLAREWEHYLGWKEDRPPQVIEAVRLICEHYYEFIKRYGKVEKGRITAIDIGKIDAQRKAWANEGGGPYRQQEVF